jgi:hypothetical protein
MNLKALVVVKMFLLTTFLSFMVQAGDKKTEPPSHEAIESAKIIKSLIQNGLSENDPYLLMAAAKMMIKADKVAILKPSAKGKEADNITDADIWEASELYKATAKIAGKSTELGKTALALSKSHKVEKNAEGCYGYNHYHWWYDSWGYYHEIWHYC